MSRYMVSWKANPSAWPTDPKQALTVIEGLIAGGDQLIKAGAAEELNWFTPQEGYGIFEADSKASVLGMVQGFFPYYSQDVREVARVPDDDRAQAVARPDDPTAHALRLAGSRMPLGDAIRYALGRHSGAGAGDG